MAIASILIAAGAAATILPLADFSPELAANPSSNAEAEIADAPTITSVAPDEPSEEVTTGSETAPPAPETAEIDAPPEPPSSASPASEPERRSITVARGDTLLGLLDAAGIETAEALEAVAALREVGASVRLKVGQRVEMTVRTDDGAVSLVALTLTEGPTRSATVTRDDDGDGGFTARIDHKTVRTETRLTELRIVGSLDATARAAGLPTRLLATLVRAYAHSVDFQRDLRAGDRLTVLHGRDVAENGTVVGGGVAEYARLTVQGKPHVLVRWRHPDGKVDYLDGKGATARRALLRTPLDAVRVTSGYGMRRHPILGYTRMHRGVDFAAPDGTPVYAAGDGLVAEAEVKGGYGRYLRLSHGGIWSTAYGHLSRYAKGLRPGQRVRQGQIVAYVGATGRATGPHLHFEVLRNGGQVDPASVARVRTGGMDGRELEAFRRRIGELEATVSAMRRDAARKVAMDEGRTVFR